MDFEVTYTPEQEAFRAEVRAWSATIFPRVWNSRSIRGPVAGAISKIAPIGSPAGRQRLALSDLSDRVRRWGLSVDFVMILEEELDRYGLHLPPYYDSGGRLGGASIFVWGSEEQKQAFLPPIFRGEWRTWQLLSEPNAGLTWQAYRRGRSAMATNTSSMARKSTWAAARLRDDVDDRGHGSQQAAPRKPGLADDSLWPTGGRVRPMELLTAGGEGGASPGLKHTVFFDNARVPAFNLVGGENNGWRVATTHLELEHGGGGMVRRNNVVDRFLEYCTTTKHNGETLSKDPDVRDAMVEVYIKNEIVRLFGLRTYWLSHAHKPRSYEGPQLSYCRKTYALDIAERCCGPWARMP